MTLEKMMIIGTGIDIVEIARFRKILAETGERFWARVFTSEEQRFCLARRDPVPHFAARFAAKEAVFKALGTGWSKGVTWLDVEGRRLEYNAPEIWRHGAAAEIAASKGVKRIHISLTHTDAWAAATAVLE
jgi:holo-[acyl-carrier protein] synthase